MIQRLMSMGLALLVCVGSGCEPVQDSDVPDAQRTPDAGDPQDINPTPTDARAPGPLDGALSANDLGQDAPMESDAATDSGQTVTVDAQPPAAPDAAPMVPDAAPMVPDAAPMVPDAAAPPEPGPCGPNRFFCEQSGHCIPSRWLCDLGADCEPFGEDESDEVCSVHPLPDRCFIEEVGFGDNICYPGCWNRQRCQEHERCEITAVGEACIPDCRATGCPNRLICGEDGRCSQDPTIMIIGTECESSDECLGRTCCVPTVLEPEKLDDPRVRVCLPMDRAEELNPGGRGRCQGSCETCLSMTGTTWCYRGNCFFDCNQLDHNDDWEEDVLQLGQCVVNQDYCWAGFCQCIDSQTGLCLVPAP